MKGSGLLPLCAGYESVKRSIASERVVTYGDVFVLNGMVNYLHHNIEYCPVSADQINDGRCAESSLPDASDLLRKGYERIIGDPNYG